jgi:hypothetical protein
LALRKATRKKVFLKIAITGASGTGKTFGALRLAFGLGGRVAVIDTENKSADLYAHLGDYDVLDITPPFTAQKYIEAIREIVAEGYDVVIIDSLSHVWAGEGGLLDQKSAKDRRGGDGSNKFNNWADITQLESQLKGAILQSPIHTISTMRTKQEYVQEGGKVKKLGMAPVMRDGWEYEFTTLFDVDTTHTAITSKDRTGLFTDEVAQITEDYGRRFIAWLEGGVEATPVAQPASVNPPAEQPDPDREKRTAVKRTIKAMIETLPEDQRAERYAEIEKNYGAPLGRIELTQAVHYLDRLNADPAFAPVLGAAAA